MTISDWGETNSDELLRRLSENHFADIVVIPGGAHQALKKPVMASVIVYDAAGIFVQNELFNIFFRYHAVIGRGDN